jgi:egghead protein (zeste-white 4 protein)
MTVAPATRPDGPDIEDELRLLPPLTDLFESVGPSLVDGPSALRLEPDERLTPDEIVPVVRRCRPIPAQERPWAPWRVRVTFAVSFAVVGVPIFTLMLWFWGHSSPAHGTAAEVVTWFSYIWLLLALPVLLNVVGALAFQNANRKQAHSFPIGVEVCFRIVTRGTNVEAVLKSAEAVRAAMAQTPLFPFSVEVVTDNALPTMEGVRTILVPKHYRTNSRARFKARALHYALEVSPISATTWLFHLDEETHITPSVIRGIHSAVAEEERTGDLRIGQGVVLYHRDLKEHPFLTLADSVRTGDDLGRFRLQHLFGQSAFGMHGSFILVRNDVEMDVGFDLGAAGSVTEDAWWSLVEMARGRRSRWVDGYCLEQSTQSVMDFLKQRRRWFVGLCLVCLQAPARLWHRVTLVTSVILWGVGWLGWWSVSVAAVIVNARIPWGVLLVGTASLAAYSALYLLGLELNLDQRGLPWYRRILWHVAQVILLPVYSLMESAAVIYGVIKPDFDFHVVKK